MGAVPVAAGTWVQDAGPRGRSGGTFGRRQATLLCHRGHGPLHYDLVINAGRRCPTAHVWRDRRGWHLDWIAPHRRRYLTFAGPIPGKGRVERCWRGWICAKKRCIRFT